MKQFLRILAIPVLFLVATPLATKGQNSAGPQGEGVSTAKPAAEGTFQLIRTGKFVESIQTEMLPLIESKRHETEVVFYALSGNLTVKILPKSEIEKPGFVPLTEIYIDLSEVKGEIK